eukprot:12668690-Ditylum_brightwellii.AAC.1
MCSLPSMLQLKRQRKPRTFKAFISMLPHWEQVLLSYFNESEHSYASLDTHLELGTLLWFVTDGGVKGPFGYFGVVIATDTQILWEGYGHSQSNPDVVESLCTESSGLLAV